MIIGIDSGHCLSGANTGSQGNGYKEEVLTREVKKVLTEILVKEKHTVIDCSVDKAISNSDSLNQRVIKANTQNLDLFISIHFNSYNKKANGSEIWVHSYSDFIRPIGNRILLNLNKLGYTNRGLKLSKNAPKGGLTVVDKTKAPAMLIECCFIDNVDDMKRYNARDIAIAIYEGIFNVKYNYNKVYRLLVGSYKVKENAINKQNELKKQGIESSIVYTEV